MAKKTRVPLSVGLASLRSSARVAALVWPSAFLFVGALGMGPVVQAIFGDGTVAGVVGMVGMVAVILAAIVGWAMAASAGDDARRERPSDLVLDAEGVRVEGGRHDGAHLMWSAITGAVVEELPKHDKQGLRHAVLWVATLGRVSRFARRVFVLKLTTRSGKAIVLAESDDEGEVASLRDLAASLETSDLGPQTSGPERPTLLGCGECGAALIPADVATATCAYCGKETTVPDDLRARIRAPEEIARGLRAEKKIARLLRQPGATSSLAFLTLFRWIGHLIWPAALALLIVIVVMLEKKHAGYPVIGVVSGAGRPWLRALVLSGLLGPVVLAAVGFTVAAFLANRRALRLVSLNFGAVPPPREGAPSTCRNCGAALPARPGRVVVGCLACGAENVLGLDLRVPARRAAQQEQSVMAALRHRFWARLRLAVTVVVAAASVAWLVRELAWTARIPPKLSESTCFGCQRHEIRAGGRGLRVTVEDKGVTRRVYVPAGATVAILCNAECRIEERRMWP